MDDQVSVDHRARGQARAARQLPKLMDEMVESTQAEPETLSYDWFVSDDGSTVHIYERYADLRRPRDPPHRLQAEVRRALHDSMVEPDPLRRLRRAERGGQEAMSGFSPTYLGTFGGFVR